MKTNWTIKAWKQSKSRVELRMETCDESEKINTLFECCQSAEDTQDQFAATLYKDGCVFFTFWGDTIKECQDDAEYFKKEFEKYEQRKHRSQTAKNEWFHRRYVNGRYIGKNHPEYPK